MKTLDAVKISVIDLSLLAVNVNERESWAGHVVFVGGARSEEHTSELQSQSNLVCRLLLEKKKTVDAQRRPDAVINVDDSLSDFHWSAVNMYNELLLLTDQCPLICRLPFTAECQGPLLEPQN